MEKEIRFAAGDIELEGLLSEAEGGRGVAVTHPHPLYGGDMHNPVVAAVAAAYRGKGYATLRFNFRGTGASGGRHEQGVGERADVLAAVKRLRQAGAGHIELAGYSFGAWVNAHLPPEAAGIERMVMIAPPVALLDFAPVGRLDHLALAVTGSRDDIAPPAAVRRAMTGWNPQARLVIIDGADHFYSGRLEELAAVLDEFL